MPLAAQPYYQLPTRNLTPKQQVTSAIRAVPSATVRGGEYASPSPNFSAFRRDIGIIGGARRG